MSLVLRLLNDNGIINTGVHDTTAFFLRGENGIVKNNHNKIGTIAHTE